MCCNVFIETLSYCKPANFFLWFIFAEEVSSNARLKLYKIKRAHAGIYRCEAKNEYGEDMYEVFIQAACKYK